jgi:hypothetical protein
MVEPSWLAAVLLIVGNIFGWGVIHGKLNGRVKSLEETTKRHEKMLNENGLMREVSECKSAISNLTGTVQTYIDLTKRG